MTGSLAAPEPDEEHRPLTLEDLRRSTKPGGGPRSVPSPSDSTAVVEPDRFASPTDGPDRVELAGSTSSSPGPERPPLFPAPPAPSATADTNGELHRDESPREVLVGDDAAVSHPYFDLPYDDPSPAPGSDPEPEPTSRRRRRRTQDDRPNAASMAMAAGRVPVDATTADATVTVDAESSASTVRPAPPSVTAVTAPPAPPADRPPSAPADTSSLGPIVFGPTESPADALLARRAKAKSSPLSVAAILMTIAIAAIVLWPTYRSLVDGDAGPALPPPSAGVIGYAPAGPDGVRAAVDPDRTSSWATSAPAGAGFEVDMPGVVVVRTPPIPIDGGTATGTVASSSSGRGGYVVATVDAPEGDPWVSVEQATTSILGGFNGAAGNELAAGAATTLGGAPAISIEGTVDGVPSRGAMALVGNRAYLVAAGNTTQASMERFLTSFEMIP